MERVSPLDFRISGANMHFLIHMHGHGVQKDGHDVHELSFCCDVDRGLTVLVWSMHVNELLPIEQSINEGFDAVDMTAFCSEMQWKALVAVL